MSCGGCVPCGPSPAVAALSAAPEYIYVIDPANRSGKIRVPMNRTEPTLGLSEWTSAREQGRTKDVSLCMLYQKGRCLAGVGCHQIHADRDLVVQLRMQETAGGSCCFEHSNSPEEDEEFRMRILSAPPVRMQMQDGIQEIPAINFAKTLALPKTLASGQVVPMARVCRLHQQGRCKYGRDCKNLHVCRRLWQSLFPKQQQPQLQVQQPREVLPRQALPLPSAMAAAPPIRVPSHLEPIQMGQQMGQYAVPHGVPAGSRVFITQSTLNTQSTMGQPQHRVVFVRAGQVPALQQQQQPPLAMPLRVAGPLPSQEPPAPLLQGPPAASARSRSRSETENAAVSQKVKQMAAQLFEQMQPPPQPAARPVPLTSALLEESPFDGTLNSPGLDSPPALLPGSPSCCDTPGFRSTLTPSEAAQATMEALNGGSSPLTGSFRLRKMPSANNHPVGNHLQRMPFFGGRACGAGFSLAKLRGSTDSESQPQTNEDRPESRGAAPLLAY